MHQADWKLWPVIIFLRSCQFPYVGVSNDSGFGRVSNNKSRSRPSSAVER